MTVSNPSEQNLHFQQKPQTKAFIAWVFCASLVVWWVCDSPAFLLMRFVYRWKVTGLLHWWILARICDYLCPYIGEFYTRTINALPQTRSAEVRCHPCLYSNDRLNAVYRIINWNNHLPQIKGQSSSTYVDPSEQVMSSKETVSRRWSSNGIASKLPLSLYSLPVLIRMVFHHTVIVFVVYIQVNVINLNGDDILYREHGHDDSICLRLPGSPN